MKMKKKFIIIILFILLFNNNNFGVKLKNKDKLKNIIYTYIIEHNYEFATDAAQQYIKKFPDDCEGYKLLGLIYDKEMRVDKAIETYSKFSKISKCNYLNFYAGKISFLNGKYKLAIFYFLKLIKNNMVEKQINKFSLYKMLGESYFFISDYMSAIDTFQKCIKYNPYDIEIYDFISNSYSAEKRENYASAYREIKNLLIKKEKFKINENNFNFHMAIIFLKNKIYPEAIKYFTKINFEYKKNYSYNFNLGLAYLLNNNYYEAINYISLAIKLYSKKFSLKKIFLNLLKLNRQAAKYYLTLSAAYYLNNEKSPALNNYEKIKEYSPGIYKKYTFTMIENKKSKLYKELPDMWEYTK